MSEAYSSKPCVFHNTLLISIMNSYLTTLRRPETISSAVTHSELKVATMRDKSVDTLP